MVRIRMQRLGRTHRPFYRINAVDARVKRDGVVIENLGWYNPIAPDASKQVELKAERIRDWLGRGAMPSETVMDLLGKADLLEGRLKDEWVASRNLLRARGKCREAVKAIEAAVAELDKLAESTEADAEAVKVQVNLAKRELNNARATLSLSRVEKAQACRAAADAALAAVRDLDARSKAVAEAPAAE